MTDAETGQRGFLLTGNINYLEPYHNGVEEAQRTYSELLRLTSDNPVQQQRLADMNIVMR